MSKIAIKGHVRAETEREARTWVQLEIIPYLNQNYIWHPEIEGPIRGGGWWKWSVWWQHFPSATGKTAR